MVILTNVGITPRIEIDSLGGDMQPSSRIEHPVSAGGVVYRVEGRSREVLLCGRTTPALWALPKGTPDSGESLEQTALREVREETGLEVVVRASLGSIEYWFLRTQDRVRCHKTVHFYLMSPVGGDLSLHDPEFDVVRWFHEEDALKAMTYADEVGIMEKALAVVREEVGRS